MSCQLTGVPFHTWHNLFAFADENQHCRMSVYTVVREFARGCACLPLVIAIFVRSFDIVLDAEAFGPPGWQILLVIAGKFAGVSLSRHYRCTHAHSRALSRARARAHVRSYPCAQRLVRCHHQQDPSTSRRSSRSPPTGCWPCCLPS